MKVALLLDFSARRSTRRVSFSCSRDTMVLFTDGVSRCYEQ